MIDNLQTLNVTRCEHHILQIELHRPDKLNALNQLLISELDEVIAQAAQDPQTKAVLLTGHGEKAFCAGADINELAELNAHQAYQFAKRGQRVFRRLETMGKPTLAAVNGFALGGGCELSLACSIRLASDNALFGQPEVKLGVIPGYGGTQRLARVVGKGRALAMCMSGHNIKAEQALNWGLVTNVTEPKSLLPTARTLLAEILQNGPVAIASVLQVIDQGYDLPIEEALELEASHFGLCCATADKAEGVNAFLQKRKADFKGE